VDARMAWLGGGLRQPELRLCVVTLAGSCRWSSGRQKTAMCLMRSIVDSKILCFEHMGIGWPKVLLAIGFAQQHSNACSIQSKGSHPMVVWHRSLFCKSGPSQESETLRRSRPDVDFRHTAEGLVRRPRTTSSSPTGPGCRAHALPAMLGRKRARNFREAPRRLRAGARSADHH